MNCSLDCAIIIYGKSTEKVTGMTKNVAAIRSKIYDFAKDYEIFKKNTFDEACYKLTCAMDFSFIDILIYNATHTDFKHINACQESLRHSYREALKQAYRFCKAGDGQSPSRPETAELDFMIGYLIDMMQFNKIRNLFEKCDLKRYVAEVVSDNEITFKRSRSKRTVDADFYARWIDKQKPELTERQLKKSAELLLYTEMSNPENMKYWAFENKTFSTFEHLKTVYRLAREKVDTDTEDLGNHEIAGFTTEDFKKIYAALIAISVTNINYHFISRLNDNLEVDRGCPVARFGTAELLAIVNKLTLLPEPTIRNVFGKLTYDPLFHVDKVTVFQPIFTAGDTIYFSPSLVYFGMAYGKLLYVMKSEDGAQQLISSIAKEREEQMTDDLCDFIDEESELLYKANLLLTENGNPLAEYDLILYDEKHKKMLLCELKWFFKGDGENDAVKIDKKISNAIAHRLKQEKVALSRLDEIKRALDVDDGGIEVRSCIISKNYSGSDFIKDDLPVFDVFLFKNLMKEVGFDFEKLFDLIDTKRYLPSIEQLGYGYVTTTEEFAGYKINMETVGIKGTDR